MPKKPTPPEERLWDRVTKHPEGCWEWTGPLTQGYGVIGAGGRHAGLIRTHRLSYELLVGPIPEGLQIDHLCKNRKCCNPEHLEPVTGAENVRRAFENHTLCPRGHELPPKASPGVRRVQCKTCKSIYDKARHERKLAS
jgi:hypothetical protein